MESANRRLLTISLPAETARQLEIARKIELRARSEFVCEALRYCLNHPMPVEEPSPAARCGASERR